MTLAEAKNNGILDHLHLQNSHPLKQQYPQRHPHYSFKDFFSFKTDTGTIADWNESRNILVSEIARSYLRSCRTIDIG